MVHTVSNLLVDGTNLQKCVQTSIKVVLRKTEALNLSFLRIICTSRKQNFVLLFIFDCKWQVIMPNTLKFFEGKTKMLST